MADPLDTVPHLTHHDLVLPGSRPAGLRLHVVTAGDPEGSPVLLLHGFPDLWRGWRHQIRALVDAGYRVIVPEQRGYPHSDKPRRRRDYVMANLVADQLGVLDTLGVDGPVHAVGHDWGGGVAWGLATAHPARVRTVTVMNCPHPTVLRRALLTDGEQRRKSWYMFFFQLPWLAERWLDGDKVVEMIRKTGAPGVLPDDEAARYREAWNTPGATAGAVGWYRASLLGRFPEGRVTVPLHLQWGTGDVALGPALCQPSLAFADDGRLTPYPERSHWLPQEAPDAVNADLLDFLATHGGPDPHVYKIVDRTTWEHAADPWPGSADDLRDGFVHYSNARQLSRTLAKHFEGADDLLLLAVDPGRLPPGRLRWEGPPTGPRFPHLYDAMPHRAVVAQWPVRLGDDGVHVLPPELTPA